MSSSPFQVRVQPTLDPPGLRLRAQATTASDTLAFEAPGALLTVLETEASARPKIGVYGQWIRVRDASSRKDMSLAGMWKPRLRQFPPPDKHNIHFNNTRDSVPATSNIRV